jgi:hypothetical protein
VIGSLLAAGRGASEFARRALPRLRSGLALQRCKCGCDGPTPAPAPAPIRFSDVQRQWPTLTTPAAKEAVLAPAVTESRARSNRLFRSANSDPIRAIREPIGRETGLTTAQELEPSPLVGVTQDNVEQAYRAWAEGAGKEPWILLAVWKKEGAGQRIPDTYAASSAANAKALYRSRAYFIQMGTDYYIDHSTPVTGDNVTDFSDARAPAHETAFRAAIARQVTAGRLPAGRDFAREINDELAAAPAGPGRFTVTPTSRFYTLSLMLLHPYYRENEAALAADPRVGALPDPGLVYMRWNMGATRFAPFLSSAEGHRMEAAYTMPGGREPTLTQWAFERVPREDEYGQSRRNAIRYRYFVEVFRLIYEGW